MALTDHDGLTGVPRAKQRAQDLGVGFVPGCEVSCSFSPGTMHLLAYFAELADNPLVRELERLRRDRVVRNGRLVKRLGELGLPMDYGQVEAVSGGTVVGRPHFAAVLVANGAAQSIQDAFDRLLAKGAPAYVPKARVDAAGFITAVKESGAVAVLAHPLSLGIGSSALEGVLEELCSAGLVGMECYYARYSPDERSALVAMAQRHDLVATGGSDFHGSFKPGLSIGTGTGDLEVPDSALNKLLARKATTSHSGAVGETSVGRN